MDYAHTAAQAQIPGTRPSPELGRLKAVAERVSVVAFKVDSFLDRFHGPRPEGGNSASGPVTDSYRNDLESIFTALDRLENAVNLLDHVG